MTAVQEQVNGHPVTLPTLSTQHTTDAEPQEDSPRVVALRNQLHNLGAERDLLTELSTVDADPVLTDGVRSEGERDADRKVSEKVRSKARAERLRAGKAQVQHDRRARHQSRWDERAERARDRILNPARAVAANYRRWVATATALFSLVAAGVAFMSITVHHGVVGINGPWFGYLIEPLASVLLVASLVAQFTARQRGITVPRRFIAFDGAIAAASVLLNTVPYGVRYGFDATSLTAHLLVPLLVTAAVIGWHLASGMYGQVIAASRDNPVERERLAMLRHAIAAGDLPPDPSANQVVKHLRAVVPGGIGQMEGRRLARLLLGY